MHLTMRPQVCFKFQSHQKVWKPEWISAWASMACLHHLFGGIGGTRFPIKKNNATTWVSWWVMMLQCLYAQGGASGAIIVKGLEQIQPAVQVNSCVSIPWALERMQKVLCLIESSYVHSTIVRLGNKGCQTFPWNEWLLEFCCSLSLRTQ